MEQQRHTTHGRIDTSNLQLLDRMHDYRVAKGDPDPRGWKVISSDGKEVGKVDHLLVDPAERRVRYLGLDIDSRRRTDRTGSTPTSRTGSTPTDRNRSTQADGAGEVLVAVDTVRLGDDRHDERVIIPQSSNELGALPVYDRSTVQRFGETGTHGNRRSGEEERRVTLSEEELAVQKRRAQAGEVEVDKTVETEHVREAVPVKREEVTVERQPASGRSTSSFQDEEIRVPVKQEEVVVEKRTVPKEDVVVKKREVTGTETVDETVRKEHAEVHEKGNVEHAGSSRR